MRQIHGNLGASYINAINGDGSLQEKKVTGDRRQAKEQSRNPGGSGKSMFRGHLGALSAQSRLRTARFRRNLTCRVPRLNRRTGVRIGELSKPTGREASGLHRRSNAVPTWLVHRRIPVYGPIVCQIEEPGAWSRRSERLLGDIGRQQRAGKGSSQGGAGSIPVASMGGDDANCGRGLRFEASREHRRGQDGPGKFPIVLSVQVFFELKW